MEQNFISGSASPQSHTFRPGGQPVVFKVTVTNDSEQHADFKLEIIPAGANAISEQWYRLSPEISAAKPPGSSTDFQIIIFASPIPGFVGTASLRIRIVSPRLRQERTLVVHLRIEADNLKSVSVELPVRQFQVYPSNSVDIPVRVRNLGQKPAEVVLRLSGIDPSWLNGSAQRRLQLQGNSQVQTAFQCKPATVTQALSREYPFTIEATSRDANPSNTEGTLEVLPVGFVEFIATPQQQTIPRRGWWIPDWKSNSAIFELSFKNASNLLSVVDVQLQGKNHRQCSFNYPKNAQLTLGQTTQIPLEVKTQRPWVGWIKTLQFDAKAILSDQRLGGTDPTTQALELKVLPVLPIWLQLAIIALLALLLSLLFQVEVAHTDSINVVRFSADGYSAVSGSNDGTIRSWRVNGLKLAPLGENEPQNQKPKGVLGITGGEVFSLRFDPRQNNRVAAGMKNSIIQLWDIAKREKEPDLKPDFFGKTDKVFDLVFTQNDQRYLISAYPNRKVLIWARNSATDEFQPQPERSISIDDVVVSSMALSRDDKILAVAGNFKSLTLLNLDILNSLPKTNKDLSKDDLVKYQFTQGRFAVANPKDANSNYGLNDRINTVAFTPQKNSDILAVADSDGYITILDYQCQIRSKPDPKQPLYQQECQRDRWQVAQKQPVRSIVFSSDGKKLVSASDDGRVIVWQLTSEGKRSNEVIEGQEIAKKEHLINSIDINNQGNMVIIGGQECQNTLNGKKCLPELIPLN
jgi:WD40 repeat protein